MTNSDIVGLAERLCDHCGKPRYRHVQIVGAGLVCPANAFTFSTSKGSTILSLKSEIEALREVMRDTARQLREFWAQDSGTSIHLVAADNLDRAALSGSPEG